MKTLRKNIFSFPEVRVVEASAGSGKTFALAKRYVQLLLNPALHQNQIPIRGILAITFTNKAAFEMKARILEFLKKIALGRLTKEEERTIISPLGISEDLARNKAAVIMIELIHNYNFFQVRTIESFVNAMLSGCAFKIGLSANFKIKNNAFDYIEYSLDEIIDRATHDPKIFKLFTEFLHQYIFLENKTGWFPKKDMLGLLAGLYSRSNTYGLDLMSFDLKEPDELIIQMGRILDLMRELMAALPEGVKKQFLKKQESFLNENKKRFDVGDVSTFFAKEDLPLLKGVEAEAEAYRLWKKIRSLLRKVCELEAFSLFNPYVNVYHLMMEELHKASSRDDVLFLGEFNRRAQTLFDEDMITVAELYYRLATKFHHYLLDEFQDTNALQWKNLFLMVQEALSTGGSLFYVGDKKQAIYGFRGGEAGLFDIVQHQFEAFNVQRELLTKNYRSQKAVVDFNNRVFSMENLRQFVFIKESQDKKDAAHLTEEDWAQVNNIFGSAHQESREEKKNGFVSVELIDSAKKEGRDEEVRAKLIARIRELCARFGYSDIAVLTRKNEEVELVTNWLLEEGIPVESERTMDITANSLVQELVALLGFFNSPIDNVSFSVFLTGVIFSEATGMPQRAFQEFVFGLRSKLRGEKDFYIYRAFREEYPELWEQFFEECFRNVGLYPLYEFCLTLMAKMTVLENFPDQQGFIMHFLEIIKVQEEESADLNHFLDVFKNLEPDKLYVNFSETNAVRVLTVHKAKGLEFPVVVIPFLGMDVKVGSRGGDLGQRSYFVDITEGGMDLLRIKDAYLPFSESLRDIWHKEYVKSLVSELNNIYVALTRATDELHIYIPKKVSNSRNLALWLIPEEFYQVGSPGGDSLSHQGQDANMHFIPQASFSDWISFLQEEFVEDGFYTNRKKIQNGIVLHFILSKIFQVETISREKIVYEAMLAAQRQFPQINDFSFYQEQTERLLSAEKIKPFFFAEQMEIKTEVDFVDRRGHTRRIDRLMLSKDEVWVIDYKSSREDSQKHAEQMEGYLSIMKELYSKRKVRGFLIYLDGQEAEEVTGKA